eukprot:scaffold36483_cov64-Phaeocystis_antarctica.AAC.2
MCRANSSPRRAAASAASRLRAAAASAWLSNISARRDCRGASGAWPLPVAHTRATVQPFSLPAFSERYVHSRSSRAESAPPSASTAPARVPQHQHQHSTSSSDINPPHATHPPHKATGPDGRVRGGKSGAEACRLAHAAVVALWAAEMWR